MQTHSEKYSLPVACYYCKVRWGDLPKKYDIVREHRTPLKRGGADDEINTVLSCRACNSSKGQMTELEFVDYKKSGEVDYFEQGKYPKIF